MPTIVHFCIDGVPVKKLRAVFTLPHVSAEQATGFKFKIGRSLLAYIPSAESVSFRYEDEILPIEKRELVTLPPDEQKPVSELLALLEQGFIITKKGDVRLTIDRDLEWQEQVFRFYAEAGEKFKRLFGYELQLAYGTLLGWRRQGNFIPGDDDFDVCYLSTASGRALKTEFMNIVRTLRASGERIDIPTKRRNFFVWTHKSGIKIDVFPSWIEGDHYYMTFAVGAPAGDAMRKGTVSREFLGNPVTVPLEAEAILEATYGKEWRVPDPLFQWATPKAIRRKLKTIKLSVAEIAHLKQSMPSRHPLDIVAEFLAVREQTAVCPPGDLQSSFEQKLKALKEEYDQAVNHRPVR